MPSRRVLVAAGLLAAICAVAVYFALDPAHHPFPRCMFLTLTGWQCPGCGSQRALHALLHGDVGAAWQLNPLMLAELPIIAMAFVAEAAPRRFRRLHAFILSRQFILSLLTVIIIWTIYRNL